MSASSLRIYQAFRDVYLQQFQQLPGYASVAAYDTATVLFKALAERDAAGGLREALLNLGEVQGLQQTITFNPFGDAQRRAFFVVVRDGKFVLQ